MDSNLVKLVLQEKTENKIKTFQELKDEKNDILKNLFSKYLYYEINKENFKEIIDKLEDYIYVNLEDTQLNEGDYIRYINPKFFYDLKLGLGGFVTKIDNNIIQIVNNDKILNIDNEKLLVFKKLNNEDIIKLTILENVW